ncbi:CYTH and CHAD domain-containing protein [Paraburkholderia sp. LEh10]|uniref:CYTH and CHAD domain-containing protein n=1 Tax=Paraburkholderia sp. LEh10 TaxID=2821353 RepID=UPI001AE8B4FA|nr:CYTH and CHAD domain-containing protein [Paraburkholderia sp. LEh10]MBP0594074.1 CYTH and CHAD domain-containing protein [Paraburkholderia sp. LEh10]
MESELKLLASAGNASQVLHAPAISRLLVDPARTDELTSTYFDTPDLSLHKRGASLRVRVAGDRRLQTLKFDGAPEAGLFERDEFEGPVRGDSPELGSLQQLLPEDGKEVKLLQTEGLASQLQPLFVTRVKRTTAVLRLADNAEVELAADDGVIETQTSSTSIHAVELELKNGAPEQLYELALALLETTPLRIDYMSKGDRGYELLVQEHRAPVRAQPLKLKRRYTVEETFQHIAKNCLAQIHGNERGVVSGHDPSSVHQMRVGLRRLRSALDMFADVISAPAHFDKDLRWIAGELGGARDWEVLAGPTLEQAFASARDGDDVRATREAAKGRATENRKTAAAAVDSVRYTRLVLQFTLWIESMGWRKGQTDKERARCQRSISEFANATLSRRHRKLLKRGRGLAELDDETRHRARIAAKKLRYATEFFASLFDKRDVKRYINALSKLQDDLGWRNDIVVADGLLRSLASDKPDAALGAGFARGYFASRAIQDHDAMKALWARFKRLDPPSLPGR